MLKPLYKAGKASVQQCLLMPQHCLHAACRGGKQTSGHCWSRSLAQPPRKLIQSASQCSEHCFAQFQSSPGGQSLDASSCLSFHWIPAIALSGFLRRHQAGRTTCLQLHTGVVLHDSVCILLNQGKKCAVCRQVMQQLQELTALLLHAPDPLPFLTSASSLQQSLAGAQ